MTDHAAPGASHPAGPIRTCVGCRQRALDTDLLRVVVGGKGSVGSSDAGLCVVPDPRRRASGRGAWVHLDLACVDLAIRRRAFGRALRVSAPTDPAPVREHVAVWTEHHHRQDTTSGSPQEMTSYGHSMKRQQ